MSILSNISVVSGEKQLKINFDLKFFQIWNVFPELNISSWYEQTRHKRNCFMLRILHRQYSEHIYVYRMSWSFSFSKISKMLKF
jgi:hypothetical protein